MAPLSETERILSQKVISLRRLVVFNLIRDILDRAFQNGPRGGRPDAFWLFSSYATQEEKRLREQPESTIPDLMLQPLAASFHSCCR